MSQALDPVAFEGPDQDNVIRFRFKSDRIWKEADIKEVLSFKILPDDSPMNALMYTVGTASYLALPPDEGKAEYYKVPGSQASITRVVLAPFIDNSTYTTEFSNGKINVLLETPFRQPFPDPRRFNGIVHQVQHQHDVLCRAVQHRTALARTAHRAAEAPRQQDPRGPVLQSRHSAATAHP